MQKTVITIIFKSRTTVMRNFSSAMIFGLALLLTTSATYAETEIEIEGALLSVEDDVLGVEVKFDNDGKLINAVSTFHEPVNFPDRSGINKAYIIAEEKAKGQLARFISQEVTSSRTVEMIDVEISKAERNRTAGASKWSKDDVREIRNTLSEISSSHAREVLKGVRVLKRYYDEKKEEVVVTIGISQKSTSASGQLKDSMSSQSSSDKSKDFPSQRSESKSAREF
jgi:hypothetical protein